MKTKIYIDGYNLYYGCLKHSPYKWLDIQRLFSDYILKIQSPDSKIIKIKYFTADIKARVASRGQNASIAQANYHRALTTLYPNEIEIIKGYYSLDKAELPVYKNPPDKNDRTTVWRLEEKQTDVNIALHAYRDAIQSRCEHIVIVSNDTDLEPALKMIREDLGNTLKIGIVVPAKKPTGGKGFRPPSVSLKRLADWTRTHILEDELINSQLPRQIPTKKKPILKPDYW
ncbi:MAG: NYN domain-containing protein [Gammaproteobacteria bacterium]|nr:NYN domain-containing protein [Gammaproteobacteria bacterium]